MLEASKRVFANLGISKYASLSILLLILISSSIVNVVLFLLFLEETPMNLIYFKKKGSIYSFNICF
jgi:hypothetical protein